MLRIVMISALIMLHIHEDDLHGQLETTIFSYKENNKFLMQHTKCPYLTNVIR